LPIAIFCNSLRVSLTGFISVYFGENAAKGAMHENLGWFMMIPALLLQVLVAWILDRIFVEEHTRRVKQETTNQTPTGSAP
jgi:exosortase/archaeosortase family protein